MLAFDVSVLKSDSSNGVFALSPASLNFSTIEGENITVVMDRDVGTFGSVVVKLEVRHFFNGDILGEVAVDDFYPSSGEVTFTDGQTVEVSCCKNQPSMPNSNSLLCDHA